MHYRHLIIRFFESRKLSRIPLPLKPMVLFLPLALIFFPVYLYRVELHTSSWQTVFAVIIAASEVYIGQLLLYIHHTHIHRSFWDTVGSNCDDEAFAQIREAMGKIQKITTIAVSAVWRLIFIALPFAGMRGLEMIHVNGIGDPFFYVVLLLFGVIGYITSLGFGQAIIMIIEVIKIARSNVIAFQPLHYDNAGGFAFFGKYSFQTMLILSSGILFIPVAVEFAIRIGHQGNLLMYLIILLFVLALLFSFILPVLFSYFSARDAKWRKLLEIGKSYEDARSMSMKDPSVENRNTVMIISDYYEKTKHINPYPFQISNIVRLLFTSLLPVFAYIFQTIINTDEFSAFILGLLGR